MTMGVLCLGLLIRLILAHHIPALKAPLAVMVAWDAYDLRHGPSLLTVIV